MNLQTSPTPQSMTPDACEVSEMSIPQLVAVVYCVAPESERGALLEQLLRPLGALSLVAVAGGIFAKIRFRAGFDNPRIRVEDIGPVGVADVMALVEHVLQVSGEAVDGLASLLMSSPALAASGAAALLLSVLMRRARERRGVKAGTDAVLGRAH